MKKKIYLYAAVFLFCSILVSLFLRLDFSQAILILKELRVPRTITAIAVGSILALCGVVLQTVLSNPLSEPYTLGIASGAALGAAITMSMKLHLIWYGLNGGAVIGSLAILFLLLRFAKKSGNGSEAMILIGIMLSLFGSSLLAVWMALADPLGVQSVTFWLLGDLSRVELKTALALMILSIAGLLFFIRSAKKLDAFLFGENWVESFGVSHAKTQIQMVMAVSILIGFSVSAVGMIGFVGLVIPHWARRVVGVRHHDLILMSAILGAGTLCFSDGLARAVGDPHELPVGAVTALVGAPIFIFLILNRRASRAEVMGEG